MFRFYFIQDLTTTFSLNSSYIVHISMFFVFFAGVLTAVTDVSGPLMSFDMFAALKNGLGRNIFLLRAIVSLS